MTHALILSVVLGLIIGIGSLPVWAMVLVLIIIGAVALHAGRESGTPPAPSTRDHLHIVAEPGPVPYDWAQHAESVTRGEFHVDHDQWDELFDVRRGDG